MKIPPTLRLETQRCWLTAVSKDEVKAVYETLHFPRFTEGLLLDPPENYEAVEEWGRADLDAWASGERYVFTVWTKEPKQFGGRIGIRQFRTVGTWNMGCWIAPALWGQGLASEIALKVIAFGFEQLGCERIWMAHAKWNVQSSKVMNKLPVKFLENDCFEKNGKSIENVRYQITVDEWWNRKLEPGEVVNSE